MEMEEQILAEGCREGEDTARRELYDRYAARLLAVCLRYSGDRATAEDLMHDAFLKIYGGFRPILLPRTRFAARMDRAYSGECGARMAPEPE